MPMPSPKYWSGGSLKKLATDSYELSGTLTAFALLWARSGTAPMSVATKSDDSKRLMCGASEKDCRGSRKASDNQGNLYPRTGLFNSSDRLRNDGGVIGRGRTVRHHEDVFQAGPCVVATPR